MYYKQVNKKSAKEMFQFLKEHFQYYTLSSWNGLKSIANNVKVYNLQLDGDMSNALYHLIHGNGYFGIEILINEWELMHKGYKIGFNGRSDGYVVLYNSENNHSILPYYVEDYSDYEAFKEGIHSDGYTVKDLTKELKYYVKLVQDFDELCDSMRKHTNELSQMPIEELDE